MPIIIAVSVIGGLLIIAVLSMITCMIYKTMISPRTKTHDLEHVLKNEKSFTSVRSYKQYPPKSTTLTSEKRTPWCKHKSNNSVFMALHSEKMHTGTVDIILDKTSCSCFFYYWSPEVLITSGNDKPLFGPTGFFNAVGRISCISICYYHYTSIMFHVDKRWI